MCHNVLPNPPDQFEYQQATLEAEVENLSWKVERAEITDRGVSSSSIGENRIDYDRVALLFCE